MPRRSTRRRSQNAIAGGTVFATAMLSTGPAPPTDALAGTPVHAQQVANDTTESISSGWRRSVGRPTRSPRRSERCSWSCASSRSDVNLKARSSRSWTARSTRRAAISTPPSPPSPQLEETAIEQRPGVEARLVELYKLGRPRYTRLLLGVDDIRSIGRAYRMVSEIAELDRRRLAEHRETLAALRTSREDLTTRHAELAVLVADAETTRRELDRSVRRQTARVNPIDERRDLTASSPASCSLPTSSCKRRSPPSPTGTNVGLRAAALPLRPFLGELPHPVDGPVATQFGAEQ